MQFKSNNRLKGRLGRLIARVSLFTLVFSMIGVVGSASVSAEEAPEGVDAQGISDASTMSGVELTGNFERVRIENEGKGPTFIGGWACAPDEPFRDLRIDVYNMAISGGQFTRDAYLGNISANQTRDPAVAAACGGNPNQGFSGHVDSVCDGRTGATLVEIEAWAVYSDSPGIAIKLPNLRPSANVVC